MLSFFGLNKYYMKEIEIWMEGFVITGQSSTAKKIGTYEADSLDEAVRKYTKDHPDSTVDFNRYGKGKHAIWACQLFDNESEARKSFG
jgi:hypothetical protein